MEVEDEAGKEGECSFEALYTYENIFGTAPPSTASAVAPGPVELDESALNAPASSMQLIKSSQMTPPKSVESVGPYPVPTPQQSAQSSAASSSGGGSGAGGGSSTGGMSGTTSTSTTHNMPPVSYDDLNNIFEEESSTDEQQQPAQQQPASQQTTQNQHANSWVFIYFLLYNYSFTHFQFTDCIKINIKYQSKIIQALS